MPTVWTEDEMNDKKIHDESTYLMSSPTPPPTFDGLKKLMEDIKKLPKLEPIKYYRVECVRYTDAFKVGDLVVLIGKKLCIVDEDSLSEMYQREKYPIGRCGIVKHEGVIYLFDIDELDKRCQDLSGFWDKPLFQKDENEHSTKA
jgi:hypothetical protein